jgi:hypothetical protein
LAGAVFGAGLMGMLASGCSTVVFSHDQSAERKNAVERDALVLAAAAIAETKWPQPQSASWAARLTGGGDDEDRISEDDAISAYVKALGAPPGRQEIVFADAANHLTAANALVDAAETTAETIRPMAADIAVMEEAIGELRENRDIYVACLKTLAREGETVDSARLRALKADFNEAIEAVGDAADVLAEKVAKDRTETVARTERRNFDPVF